MKLGHHAQAPSVGVPLASPMQQHRYASGRILLATMAQGEAMVSSRQSNLTSLERGGLGRACAHASVAHCVAFLDTIKGVHRFLRRPDVPAGHFRLVRPQEFGATNPSKRGWACCPAGKDRRSSVPLDTFFCKSHTAMTLASQYRFLPALQFLREAEPYAAGWRSGALGWLALVDDDSYVDLGRLARLLLGRGGDAHTRLGANQPLYLGDMAGPWANSPFACGGAGSILSRAAVQRTDFGKCARNLNETCAQSDWMIGACVKRAGVRAVKDFSCGLCATSACDKVRVDKLQHAVKSGCAFAQLTNLCPSHPAYKLAVCRRLPATGLAVSHGFARLCGSKFHIH